MKIQQGKPFHLEEICQVMEQAKRRLKALGLDQWQKGYPSRAVWEEDLDLERAWVATSEGAVIAAFTLTHEPEPSYQRIQGAWWGAAGERYTSLHRLCVGDAWLGQGVAGLCLAFALEQAAQAGDASLRVDTHPNNGPMNRALEKAGFRRCGQIHLVGGPEDGDLRVAYERVLSPKESPKICAKATKM